MQDQRITPSSGNVFRDLGVTQPRTSDLVRSRIDLFSIDGLVDMLACAGIKVDVTVSPMPERGAA